MSKVDAAMWIKRLELTPHPEGGYYRETYRAERRVTSSGVDGDRSASTAIYFLLERGQLSALHRIRSDEVWHFYAGATLVIRAILPDGSSTSWRLGVDVDAGDLPQCVVPAGAWFGAELADGDSAPEWDNVLAFRSATSKDYALVGCTVAPGFEFVDFEMADRSTLMARYPQHAVLIERLTC